MSKVICILGMHRSNTSMLTRMLHICGAAIGSSEHLVGADDASKPELWRAYGRSDNPEGYWEDERFVAINDEILHAMGGSVNSPPRLQDGWEQDTRLAEATDKARGLLEQRSVDSIWLWKDPRTCLTLAFWKVIVPDLRPIVMVRHPLEVAASIAKRAYGDMAPDYTLDLWLKYYQQLYLQLGATDRIVTHSDTYFFDCNSELLRVCGFAGLAPSAAKLEEACGTAEPKLRRSKILVGVESDLEERIERLYWELCEQCGPVYHAMSKAQTVSAESFGSREELIGRIAELQGFFALKARVSQEREADLAALRTQVQSLTTKLRPGNLFPDDETLSLERSLKERDDELKSLKAAIHQLESHLSMLTPYERWIPLVRPLQSLYLALRRGKKRQS